MLYSLHFRPVFDIHDIVNISIFDEDRRGAPEFLGRVGIPLLSVGNHVLLDLITSHPKLIIMISIIMHSGFYERVRLTTEKSRSDMPQT